MYLITVNKQSISLTAFNYKASVSYTIPILKKKMKIPNLFSLLVVVASKPIDEHHTHKNQVMEEHENSIRKFNYKKIRK